MAVQSRRDGWASRAVSAVPSGLDHLGNARPNVETLGYCRMSLRDKVFVDYFKSIFRFESLVALVPLVLSSVLRAARCLSCWTQSNSLIRYSASHMECLFRQGSPLDICKSLIIK